MSLQLVKDEIRSHFNTGWASETPIAWDNVKYTPNEPSEYVELVVKAETELTFNAETNESNVYVGNPIFEFSGKILCRVFVPGNTNSIRSDVLTQKVVDIFNVASSTVCYRDIVIKTIGSESIEGDSQVYYRQDVEISWFNLGFSTDIQYWGRTNDGFDQPVLSAVSTIPVTLLKREVTFNDIEGMSYRSEYVAYTQTKLDRDAFINLSGFSGLDPRSENDTYKIQHSETVTWFPGSLNINLAFLVKQSNSNKRLERVS